MAIHDSLGELLPKYRQNTCLKNNNATIVESDRGAKVKSVTWYNSDFQVIDPVIAKDMTSFFQQSDSPKIFHEDCDGIMIFEKDGKKYLFLTELKSTFDSSDIFHASTQLVSSYLKINMLLHLLPCYRCEDFIVKGFIVSHEPNPSYIRDLQKAMFLPKRSKYKTDAEFVTDLLIRGRKFSTTVQPTDYHELKGLPLGERGIFSSMEIHYIPISDKQPSISIDALEYI